jgi:3',5'-cyclic-AMP phosphodiesterase
VRTRIVHLSDAHVSSEGKEYLPGVDLAARCSRALSVVRTLDPSPGLIVLGGDMLDEGPSPDYGRLSALVAGAPCPVHLCLGNHDSLDAFRKAPLPTFPPACPGYYAFDCGGFRLLILFTAAARRGKGDIDQGQLAWLAGELEALEGSQHRALLFMHHPPVDVGIPWLDAIRVENAGQFWDAVAPFAAHVAGIFFAHLHIQVSMSRQGILLASPPAAGWQFRADHNAARAETSDELPGFNVIEAWDEPAADSSPGANPSRSSGLLARTVRFIP